MTPFIDKLAETKSHTERLAKKAPCMPSEMLKAIENLAADESANCGLIYFASSVFLMASGPFRFKGNKHNCHFSQEKYRRRHAQPL